jgi:hypothetical protein
MWKAAEELERKRLTLLFTATIKNKGQVFLAMADVLANAYGQILDDEDLKAFLTDPNGADDDGIGKFLDARSAKNNKKKSHNPK